MPTPSTVETRTLNDLYVFGDVDVQQDPRDGAVMLGFYHRGPGNDMSFFADDLDGAVRTAFAYLDEYEAAREADALNHMEDIRERAEREQVRWTDLDLDDAYERGYEQGFMASERASLRADDVVLSIPLEDILGDRPLAEVIGEQTRAQAEAADHLSNIGDGEREPVHAAAAEAFERAGISDVSLDPESADDVLILVPMYLTKRG